MWVVLQLTALVALIDYIACVHCGFFLDVRNYKN